MLYRNGDRTPIAPYKNDPYNNELFWPIPYGELTNIGKLEHLQLGRWLRKRYFNFLSDVYSPYEIYVQSTDVDRTLMSAESNLAGLYPLVENQVWDDEIRWTLIPVHTIPAKQDYVLQASQYCPRYQYELENLLRLPEIERIKEENADLFTYLTEHSGDKINSFKMLKHLYDVLYIESLYNKTLPQWTKSVFPEKMKSLAAFSFMTEAYNTILRRLKTGPLLGEMIDHMSKKMQHILQPDRKIWMYSAHGETIANLLMTLNIFEPHCPPYAAIVLIELRTNSKNQYFVTVSYKNTTEEPIILTLPGCTTLCPLNEFINLTKNVVPEDWEKECWNVLMNDISSKSDISFSDVIGLLALTIGFMYWYKRREHRRVHEIRTYQIRTYQVYM
ncbi:prostatic acid phosphatase isoform X2 [Monomorium pharaonis]|uniref:prostatic acid phosphatase isoform X2 n=1 Tax=Monomorium pharaonis TaxID=307658 RepID=UPI00174736D6|nr:prostatic acid phosphatase isoform X2 [Monomorium pharaonis]